MRLDKYIALAKADIAERWIHVHDKIFNGVFIAVILFVFLQVWIAIFAGKDNLEGYTIAQMIWYLGFAEVFIFASGTEFIKRVSADVKTGAIAMALLKPMNYAGQKFTLYCDKLLHDLLTLGPLVIITAYLLVGPIALAPFQVALAILAGITGTILNFCIVMSIGLLAFWLEDVSALEWIYMKSIFIFGGMLVPLEVYPHWMQGIVKYLPFSYIMYRPSKLFIQFSGELFWSALFGQLLWIVFWATVVVILYRFAQREVTIHGG